MWGKYDVFLGKGGETRLWYEYVSVLKDGCYEKDAFLYSKTTHNKIRYNMK
jgi:hypothetical protein